MVVRLRKAAKTLDLVGFVSAYPPGRGLYTIGNRGEGTCRELWGRIPEGYREGSFYSDFWESYQKVFPEDRHRSVGKESGQTSHVERWNCTLRQRLGRFVRKTLSFSKSEEMHEICLVLFLHYYNRLCL